MKILVLGATGGQGLPTVRELIAEGYDVTGFTIANDPKIPVIEELGAKVICGNLMNYDDLLNAGNGRRSIHSCNSDSRKSYS